VIEGFIASGVSVVLHDQGLLAALDQWLAGLNADEFAAALPVIRRTFALLGDGERRRLGELIRRPDDQSSAVDPALDPERAALALSTVELLLGMR
jgi:hypothetical protein